MQIKDYDFFAYWPNYKKYSSIDYRDHAIDHISYLLEEGCPLNVEDFLKKLKESFEYGLYQYFAVIINDENDLIYITDLHYYDYSLTKNMSASTIIKLCNENSLGCNIMTENNFIHLLLAWNNIRNQLSPFALLYLDDKDWYDVLPFQTQEEMEQFIKAEIIYEQYNFSERNK
ncbi:MAG: hypothetical protein JO129_04355 [Candidatus Dependentiae bacterium]|nr:hypothetical protein [Candidatus Dependentiae bacterium]